MMPIGNPLHTFQPSANSLEKIPVPDIPEKPGWSSASFQAGHPLFCYFVRFTFSLIFYNLFYVYFWLQGGSKSRQPDSLDKRFFD